MEAIHFTPPISGIAMKENQMIIEEDTAARMVAVLCASLLAAAAREADHGKVLATSDIYLDFIRPRSLHVNREGDVSFEMEDI